MLWADKALEQRGGGGMCAEFRGKGMFFGGVKSNRYNGRKSIKEEDKWSMSHRKLEAGVGHT